MANYLPLVKELRWVKDLNENDSELFNISYLIREMYYYFDRKCIFVIDLVDVIKWIHYEAMDHAKYLLSIHFTKNEGYMMIVPKRILLTVECAIDLCTMINGRGRRIGEYYLKIRSSICLIIAEEREKQEQERRKLIQQKLNTLLFRWKLQQVKKRKCGIKFWS